LTHHRRRVPKGCHDDILGAGPLRDKGSKQAEGRGADVEVRVAEVLYQRPACPLVFGVERQGFERCRAHPLIGVGGQGQEIFHGATPKPG
jgi:hypothetical protein